MRTGVGQSTALKRESLMRKLLLKAVMVAPLCMAIAIVSAGTTQNNPTLGREVGSTEASGVLGTACFYLKEIDCPGCTGKKSTGAITTEYEEANSGGCSTGCDSSKLGKTCAG